MWRACAPCETGYAGMCIGTGKEHLSQSKRHSLHGPQVGILDTMYTFVNFIFRVINLYNWIIIIEFGLNHE